MAKFISWLTPIGQFALHKLLPAAALVALGVLGIQAVLKIVKKVLEKSKLEKAAHTLIITACQVVLYILLALTAASSLGIDVTGIVALASVLTLAVSLAVQNMLTNVFGGFTLLYTKPFVSEDFVEIAGQSGTVKEIGLTYTKLATVDNRIVSIPNSTVTTAQIVNYSATGTRRVEIPVTASYDAPVQKVLDALVQAGTMDNVLLDPAPAAVVVSYGDSAISYELRVWTKTEDYWGVKYAITQKVKTIFDETGIEMTYPHLNVHVRQ